MLSIAMFDVLACKNTTGGKYCSSVFTVLSTMCCVCPMAPNPGHVFNICHGRLEGLVVG